MKLQFLNDLHIEFEDFTPPVTDADVVILAGDIRVGIGGLQWAEAQFPDRPVIYVPGNHEFYHHDIVLTDESKTQAPHHIHVLNDDQVVIDGVRFLSAVPENCALFRSQQMIFGIHTGSGSDRNRR